MTTLRAYVHLTKPDITLLVVITGLPALLIATQGRLSTFLLLSSLLGIALAAAAASALNCYLERDIDALMDRTSRRPLPRKYLSPEQALVFGIGLGILGVGLLAGLVNLLSALLALGTILFYVLVYTVWLKPWTSQNIVIGGAAGCAAPLIAWAAAVNHVGMPAWILFAIIFLWTPPHFWALALYRKRDYIRAGIPMLPVVAGDDETRRQILVYTVLTVPTTLLLYPLGAAGILYLVGAAVLGVPFIHKALVLYRQATDRAASALFRYSITYLLLLFLVLTVDAVWRFGFSLGLA